MNTECKKNIFPRLFAQAAIWLLIAFGIGFAAWTVFFTETGNGDNVEHIHATWLVAYGEVPYRDFFQHHNPLLWYLFAPVIRLLGGNALQILDAAHAMALSAGFAFLFIVYKICTRFFASRYAALLSLLVLCPPYYYIYCFNYNPDTFMALSLAVGLYFLFTYWENKRLPALVLSFVSFFVAFLFTQKILTVLAPLGLIFLLANRREKDCISDMWYALLIPVVGLLFFIALLYYGNVLDIYWQSNFVFNVKMQAYYGDRKIDVIDYPVFFLSGGLALLSIATQWQKQGIIYRTIALLFVLELFQRCFYFAIAPYYMLPFMAFAACLNSVLIERAMHKHFWTVWVLLIVAAAYAAISEPRYLSARTTDRSFARYVSANVTPCDYVISSFLSNQSIISKDPHYYWSLLGHVDIAGEETGIALKPDLNKLVMQYKPKLVSSGVYWNNYYLNRGRNVPVQQISPEIIGRYYLPTPFQGLYLLKYEYQGKNCIYDKNRGEWRYAG